MTSAPAFAFDNTYARELEGFYVACDAAGAPTPRLLALNRELADELGLDPDTLASPDGLSVLAGNLVPDGATPLAQAYAGHQFGGFNPQLGDGRALLLGEVIDRNGQRRDLQFKGSGRTPFSRGGDGKAAVGPVLREYLMGEAMHALGIPTTRVLAAVATGERIMRENGPLPGAVLLRVAASHLRVGTFQFFAARQKPEMVRQLADYAIARHYPHLVGEPDRYLGFLQAVCNAQASLVAQWVSVGFIHGVMNTDNMTISGETIDFGPCAFMDAFDPATVFSSIDSGGRYAYGNQPGIANWNLARLAETLLPLIDEDDDAAVTKATSVVEGFADQYSREWLSLMRAKLGLGADAPVNVIDDALTLLQAQQVDYTSFFRRLAAGTARELFAIPAAFDTWHVRWEAVRSDEVAAQMNRVNPLYIARNHKVEEALSAATDDNDLAPFEKLVEVLRDPFTERPGLDAYAEPAPPSFGKYRTFCGT